MALEKAKSKAQSKAAEWFAETKKLEAELTGAKAKLKALQAGDAVMDKVSDIPVVGEHTDYLQEKMDAFVAEAQADVMRIEAELAVAKGKLKTAQAAKDAVSSVSETMADLKSSVSEMAENVSEAVGEASDSMGDKAGDAAEAVGDAASNAAGRTGDAVEDAKDSLTS